MGVATFQRIYLHHDSGPEYPASPVFVANVLRSMNEAARGPVPFKVRFRMDDGTSVTVKPKRVPA